MQLFHKHDNDHGAAAVEFALIVPILLLLLFGIFEFGRAYNTQISLSGAAREGARVMAISNSVPNATSATLAAAPSVTPAPSVVITPTSCTPGANVTVTASRAQSYNIPFYGSASFDLSGRGVMRCGG
jgi:Flp pilus assembly protein TadG